MYDIESVNICSTTFVGGLTADRRSDYQINFKIKGTGWMKRCPVPMVDTKKDVLGELRKHKIRLQNVEAMRITLAKRGNHGVCLKNIQILVCDRDN